MSLDNIIEQVRKERNYQNVKWGTVFDDKNTVNDWSAYAGIYIAKATNMNATVEEQRAGIFKAASLLLAAVEAFDRNNGFPRRHYDKVG